MNIDPSKIFIDDYDYSLPEEKIALYPLKERDNSKLLIYRNGKIKQGRFYNIPDCLDEDSLLILNDTKVIHARLLFTKNTGAEIEIFCLEQEDTKNGKGSCKWNCMIGNLKKWKSEKLTKIIEYKGERILLEAKVENGERRMEKGECVVEFKWKPDHIRFSEILENAGLVPLPPYIKRKAEEEDKKTYQTVYAKINGSVAAPTAGLHFTEAVLQKLNEKGIKTEYLTLHVNTGTFKPVTTDTIAQHSMHKEIVSVNKETINNIIRHISQKSKINKKGIVAVGTTTCRTLESLYWFGVKLLIRNYELGIRNNQITVTDFEIGQWEPYKISRKSQVVSRKTKGEKDLYSDNIEPVEAFSAIKEYMEINQLQTLTGTTSLMIVPGYKFKVVNELITNFHQPKSTLLLLIAAFIGDRWNAVYNYALENDFRFLSYGDSCLFQLTIDNE